MNIKGLELSITFKAFVLSTGETVIFACSLAKSVDEIFIVRYFN